MFTFEPSTFVFQAVNFLILLLVLSRFLYRPLLRVMKEREEEVAARLREAEERQTQADAESAELAEALDRARREVADIVARARTEASRQADELLERARQHARATEDAARQRLRVEEDTIRSRLEQTLHDTAVRIAGSMIRQAAGPAVHQELVERVLNDGAYLDGLPARPPARDDAATATIVRWELAYPPGPDLAARLRHAAVRALGQPDEQIVVEVRVEPDLIAGWRLMIGTWAVDLSLRRTLEELIVANGRSPDGG